MRVRWLLGVGAIFLLASLAAPAYGHAYGYYGHKWGLQQFSSDASEKYGVRGWFTTTGPYVYDITKNFSASSMWVTDEVDAAGPWVEVGFTKGANGDYPNTSSPVFYLAENDSPTGADSGYWQWVDSYETLDIGLAGSVHKYGISRTGHNVNNGTTEWTWYLDGDVVTSLWLTCPDQGHPQAGGEIYCSISNPTEEQQPHMLCHGRNNGTGDDGDYFCFKNNQSVWYRWDPDHAANTEFPTPSGGISFTHSNPAYSYFNATGQ